MSTRVLFFWAATMVVCLACDILTPPDPPEPPDPPPITSVTVIGQSPLVEGDTVQFEANCGVRACPLEGVTWSSSDTTVASVTAGGLVTAVSPGNSQISASVEEITGALGLEVQALPIVLTGVAVVGDSTQELVGSYQYSCVAKYSDATEEEVTCSWSYPSPDYIVGQVDSEGLVTLWALGEPHVDNGVVTSWTLLPLRVIASYQEFSDTLSVWLTGTKWSDLPPISADAWALVPKHYPSGEVALRTMPFFIWADPGIPVQNLEDAFEFWRDESGDRIQFSLVTDSTQATDGVMIVFDPSIGPGICAIGGPTRVRIKPSKDENGEYRCANKVTLAHELGRVMGFPSMSPGIDIMSLPGEWKSHPDRREATVWTYSVPPGTIPVED